MARQTKKDQLTLTQIGTLRNTAARSTAQIISRVNKCANGELEMSNAQLKAAQISLGLVMPAMTSTEWSSVEPDHGDPVAIARQYEEQLATAVKERLHSMQPDELMTLMDKNDS